MTQASIHRIFIPDYTWNTLEPSVQSSMLSQLATVHGTIHSIHTVNWREQVLTKLESSVLNPLSLLSKSIQEKTREHLNEIREDFIFPSDDGKTNDDSSDSPPSSMTALTTAAAQYLSLRHHLNLHNYSLDLSALSVIKEELERTARHSIQDLITSLDDDDDDDDEISLEIITHGFGGLVVAGMTSREEGEEGEDSASQAITKRVVKVVAYGSPRFLTGHFELEQFCLDGDVKCLLFEDHWESGFESLVGCGGNDDDDESGDGALQRYLCAKNHRMHLSDFLVTCFVEVYLRLVEKSDG